AQAGVLTAVSPLPERAGRSCATALRRKEEVIATLEQERVGTRRPIPDVAYIEPRWWDLRDVLAHTGDLVPRGAVPGLSAGLVFLVANMGFATTEGKPAEAPMMDISTIFHGTPKPAAMTPTVDMVATGLVTHVTLSILFGIGFAMLVGVGGRALRSSL